MGEIADPALLIPRLEEAHRELAAASTTERLAMLARAVELWEDSDRIGRAAQEIATATGYAPAMVALCLRRTFAAHRAPALADLVADALAPSDRPLARTADLPPSPASQIRRRATAPALVVAILAQNTPGLAIAPALQALALGSAVVLKPASGEPHFALRLAESLGEADPRLGASCAVVTWRGGRDPIEETILAAASRVVV
jgi:acyl-CoA reductase-like NAD-dependent aldehyde dehydrogenase